MNPLIGQGLIGAGASLLGGWFGSNQNLKMQREAQQFNREERLATQAYNTSEREAQNRWSINTYNDYQSPMALADQYRKAGFNPNLALDGGVGHVASQSGSSAQSSFQGVTPPYQSISSYSQGFQHIASAFEAIANARKAGADTTRVETLLSKEVEGMEFKNRAEELNALLLDTKYSYAGVKERAEVSKLLNDVAAGTIAIDEAKERVNNLKLLNQQEKNKVDTWFERYYSDIELQDSQSAVNRSEVDFQAYRKRLASMEALDAESRAHLNSVIASGEDLQNEIIRRTKELSISGTNDVNTQVGTLVSTHINKLQGEYDKLIKQNRYFEAQMILDMISDVAGMAIGAYGGYKAGKLSGARTRALETTELH